MKSPPKMPQRAMVRIWVASLHQKSSTHERALSFLFYTLFERALRVDSNSCGADRRLWRKQGGEAGAAPTKKPQPMNGQKRGRMAAEKKKARRSSTDQRAILVGAAGFEPTASSSRTKRATNCAMPRKYRSFSAAVWLGMRESNSHK